MASCVVAAVASLPPGRAGRGPCTAPSALADAAPPLPPRPPHAACVRNTPRRRHPTPPAPGPSTRPGPAVGRSRVAFGAHRSESRREGAGLASHPFERARPRRPFGAPPLRPRQDTKPEPARAGRPGKKRAFDPENRPTRLPRGRSLPRGTPSPGRAGRSPFGRDAPRRPSARYPIVFLAATNALGRALFVDDAALSGSARSPNPRAEVDPADFGALGAEFDPPDPERGRTRNLRAATRSRSDRPPFGSDPARSDPVRAPPVRAPPLRRGPRAPFVRAGAAPRSRRSRPLPLATLRRGPRPALPPAASATAATARRAAACATTWSGRGPRVANSARISSPRRAHDAWRELMRRVLERDRRCPRAGPPPTPGRDPRPPRSSGGASGASVDGLLPRDRPLASGARRGAPPLAASARPARRRGPPAGRIVAGPVRSGRARRRLPQAGQPAPPAVSTASRPPPPS